MQAQNSAARPLCARRHLDCGGSRAATAEEAHALRDQVLSKADVLVGIGRDGFSRGVPLVKAKEGKPVVVGIGY